MPGPSGPNNPLANGTGGYQVGDGVSSEPIMGRQATPTSFTTTSTFTPAQIINGLLEYTGAGHTLTLPLATDMDTAVPNAGIDSSIEFSITATTGIATIATNTGWTIAAGCRLTSAASTASRYRARKTAAGAWTLYLVG